MNAVPTIEVQRVEFRVLPMRTRFPFKYGIASMTELPHLFVSVSCLCDGRETVGLASEGLPPKWFTKDPATTFDQDLPAMLEVIRRAAGLATAAGKCATFFDLWKALYFPQADWAAERGLPPLLANLGVSLLERAVLDAMCRGLGMPVAKVLREGHLGIRLGEIRPELEGCEVADLLPASPLDRIEVRHTVGLGDPLTSDDIAEPLDDGLPLALDDCIRRYGLSYFKVKVCGNPDTDRARLAKLAAIFGRETGGDYRITLDGNEQFADIASFAAEWQAWQDNPAIRPMLERLIFVEQPLHRDHALAPEVGEALKAWENAPPLVIDESEATLESLTTALDLGYRGTSHKNCKGIVKGIVNACLLEYRRRRHGTDFLLSGEDLANVGPVALLQDLAMMASFGIGHVERNGHHYFKGLSMYPAALQEQVLADHGDLYRRHPEGFPTLAIQGGAILLHSVVEAPFGCRTVPDLTAFPTLDEWCGT
jgi:hypothetical protein